MNRGISPFKGGNGRRWDALINDVAISEEFIAECKADFYKGLALAQRTAKNDPEVSRRNLAALQAAKGNTNPINFEVSE